ncbi:MAG: hypothetical protein GY870_21025, partial [archaeon]|nr:hypothetical protein [archaeon]
MSEEKSSIEKDPEKEDFEKGNKLSEIKKNFDNDNEKIESDDNEISSYLPVYHVKMMHFKRPIYIALLISGILAWFTFQLMGGEFQVDQETTGGGIMSGLLFVVSSVISSFIIAYMVKKRGEDALKYIMGAAFLLLTFMLLVFYGEIILYMIFFSFSLNESMIYGIIVNSYLVFCFFFSIFCIYLFFTEKMSPKSRNIYVLTLGILIGAFMASNLGTSITITLLIGISIWDIISVKSKMGPIRQIMEATGVLDSDYEEDLKKNPEDYLSDEDFKSSEIEIGIGDIAFYSMLTSH